ncbi:MAG: cysteine hydrolase family protein [Janthinobacterium lividum]
MHKIELSPTLFERGRGKRSKDFAFDDIDVARTAHVIVDMQVGFMAPGATVEVPHARDIVDNINRISRAVRAHGGVNAFLKYKYEAASPMGWGAKHDGLTTAAFAQQVKQAFSSGSKEFELWAGLDVQAQDWVCDKTRYSAFIQNTCALPALLAERKIETLIITGTLTNCCCESTARDAHQYGYNVIFVSDGTATVSDAEHNATLNNLYPYFADVMTTDKVLSVVAATAKAA